jgi:AcrR family transcriptional regulator
VTDTMQRPIVTDNRVPEILAAAEIVMDRLGHDKLSLGQIARVSLIPLARIYQYFADKNAVLGALSSRALTLLAGGVDTRGTWGTDLTESQRLGRVIERFAGFVSEPSAAYLVLCGPFDPASEETRQDAVRRLAAALGHALTPAETRTGYRSDEALEYAAELAFACLRRSYLVDGRVSATAVEMAQHAVQSFVAGAADH